MPEYLIDVNLPYYFKLWNTEAYIHQNDIDPKSSDKVIWEYAKENNLIIVTKDSDFSNRIIVSAPPPKVIHIKIGNVSMKEFHDIINAHWFDVLELINTCKLVNMYKDRIESVQ